MKIPALPLLLLLSFTIHAQTTPYTLPAPDGWGTEHFSIPISFAKSIPYKGTEDIRFAPGWADTKTDEYWAYAFLWHLEGKPAITSESIEKNLTAYYTGLIRVNTKGQKIPKEKMIPVKVSIRKTDPDNGDSETFSGTVEMMDYMSHDPIALNCIVHVRSCAGKDNTFIFHQLSPKPLTDNVWNGLRQLWTGFSCEQGK